MSQTASPIQRTVDVTGLPDEAVQAIESIVSLLRKSPSPPETAKQAPSGSVRPAPPGTPFASYEEWSKALNEWVASHRRVDTPVDDSRESIYAGRGEVDWSRDSIYE